MGNGSGVRSKKYRNSPSAQTKNASGNRQQRRVEKISTETPKEARRDAARRAVQAIIETEVVACDRLWEQLRAEFEKCFAQWDSTLGASRSQEIMQARAALRAAMLISNSAHLAVGMHRAKAIGMPVGTAKESLRQTLDNLLAKEDSEGTWRCLASSLKENDETALSIWLEEAKVKRLDVPLEVHEVWKEEVNTRSLKEKSLLAESFEWHPAVGGDPRLQEMADHRAMEAFEGRDESALRQLIAEAWRRGLDSSLAEAVLISLESDRLEMDEPRKSKQKELRQQPVDDDEDFELAALRNWGGRALKDELVKFGVDLRGAYEKEDLVQLVHDARGEKKKSDKKSKERRSSCSTAENTGNPGRTANFGDSNSSRAAADSSTGSKPTIGKGTKAQANSADAHTGRPAASQSTSGASSSNSPSPPPPRPPVSNAGMTRAAALECLGLNAAGKDLTMDELRRAYKKGALRWHPDRQQNHGKEEEAKQRFQDVRRAYELLSAAL